MESDYHLFLFPQLFQGKCDQAESWMVARENALRADDKDSLDSLEALMKKRDDLDKAMAAQVRLLAGRFLLTLQLPCSSYHWLSFTTMAMLRPSLTSYSLGT